jgi:hypothetical protein
VKVIVIATGFNGLAARRDTDSLSLFASPLETPVILGGEADEAWRGGSALELKKDEEKKKPESGLAEEGESTPENEEIWEVPAFLRKKKRR